MPGSRSRRQFVTSLASASLLVSSKRLALLDAQGGRDAVEFVWSGAVTDSSAKICVKARREGARVRLLLSTRDDLAQPRESEVVAASMVENGRVATFSADGLRPNTRYHYGLDVDGVSDPRARGRFRTFAKGPYSFSFAFGSCAATGSTSAVFDEIRKLDPHFFLHLGDFHYLNIGVNDRDAFRNGYSRVLASRSQSDLYRAVPIAYMWDDHDYGPNDSDKTAPGRDAARAAYRECVPHYPLADGGAIHQAFDIGRVRVIMTDTHSERDSRPGADRTILGKRQMDWFLGELTEAARSRMLVIWANPDPWIAETNRTGDGWAPFCVDRRTIARHIAQVGLVNRLLVVSGDAHMLAIDDGTHSNYATDGCSYVRGAKAFPVFQAAAFDRMGSIKGGPYSTDPLPGRGHFGLVDVTDTGGDTLSVTLSGRDMLRGEVMRMSLTYPLTLTRARETVRVETGYTAGSPAACARPSGE